MSVLQFSAPNLSALLNITNAQNTVQSASGNTQFASLLDIVGNPEPVTAPTPANYQPPIQNVQNSNINTNNVVDAPAPITVQKPKTQDTQQHSAQTAPQNNAQNTNSNAANSAQPTQSTQSPQPQSVATPAATPPPKAQTKSTATNTTDATNSKISTAKVATPIDSLEGLLNILAGLIGGLNVTPQVVPAAPATNTPVTTADATATGVQSTNSPLTLATPVFAKLQQDLAQLQQLLQGAGSSTPPTLSDTQNSQLLQINTALAGDLSAIKNLVATTGQPASELLQQIAAATQTPITSTASQLANTTSQLPAVQQLLSSDISSIQNLLQKFATQNLATAPATTSSNISNIATPTNTPTTAQTQVQPQTQTSVQPQSPTPTAVAASAIPAQQVQAQNSQATATTTGNNANNSTTINATSATTTSQIAQPQTLAQNQQNTQLQNNFSQSLAGVVTAVAGANDNNNSNNSSQNNSGQGGNNQPQIMAGAVSSNVSQISTGADTTDFSSILKANGASITEQVAFQVKTAAGSGDSKISIQLHPNDLGKVDVTLDVGANGKTSVNVTADNKQTLDLLQSNSSSLQKALSDAGLTTDSSSLSFNLRGGNQGQGQNQQNQYQAANNYSKSQPTEEETIAPIATVTRAYTMQVQDGLDMKV